MTEHFFQLLLVMAGGALASLYPLLRGWRTDAKEEGASAAALERAIKDIGRLEAQLKELKQDIDGVAEMARNRFKKLEQKGTALETMLTGELPRITGETETIRG